MTSRHFFGHTILSVLLTLGAAESSLASEPIKAGPEILVSTDDYYYEGSPRIASDPFGNFLVIWQSDDGVQGRRFFGDGGSLDEQFQISRDDDYISSGGSTSTGDISVAADPVGNFVVAYTAYDYTYSYTGYRPCYGTPCLFTRRNLESGKVAPAVFTINDPQRTRLDDLEPDEDQNSNPEIVALSTGEFVVLWEGYDYSLDDQTGEVDEVGEGVFGQLTVKIGQTKGSSFRVNEETDAYQGQYGDLAGAGGPDGGFVVAFNDEGACCDQTPGGRLRVQLFDKRAERRAPEFPASSLGEDGRQVDVAQAGNGNFMVVWTGGPDGTGQGRIFDIDGSPLTNDFDIGDGTVDGESSAPLAVAASDDSFVVTWSDDQLFGRRFDHSGGPLTPAFQINTQLDAYGGVDVAAQPNGDFVVAYRDTDAYIRAQQFQVAPRDPVEIPIDGRALILKNKVPDDPYKNGAKWKATLGKTTEAPPRGGDGDPRCNGDPSGTAKAVLRFVSPTSGHDSRSIPLYCQNWSASGSSSVSTIAKRGYSYSDPRLELGPCNMVKISGTRSLTVSCKGKKNLRTFDYDLVPGTSEGTVHAMLELGRYRYCSEFTTVGRGDGSDGKKFKGRRAPAGASCLPGYFTLRQCGDGQIGYDEICDDGNTDDGDYCSFDCRRETTICGDSQVGFDEACDDGNTADGDYCSADCRVETAVCGDGQVGPGEACDDGNTADGDYCRSDCKRETAICGDDQVGPGEACDDGNTDDGDYCNSDCTQVTAVCGDSVVGPGECCDDGDTIDDPGCSATCDSGDLCPPCDYSPGEYYYCSLSQCGPCPAGIGNCRSDSECEAGTVCSYNSGSDYGFPYWVDVCEPVVCGDGIREGNEACDDGNTDDGDLCSGDCTQWTPICGDNIVTPGEPCDDGNTDDGDFCSGDCTQWTPICGDGILTGDEACDCTLTSGGTCEPQPFCASDCLSLESTCGDGVRTVGECCDDGNTADGDTCSSSCDSGSACGNVCPYFPGHGNYCLLDFCGPCGTDLGDCDYDSECTNGTSCVFDVGLEYGWEDWVDVCR